MTACADEQSTHSHHHATGIQSLGPPVVRLTSIPIVAYRVIPAVSILDARVLVKIWMTTWHNNHHFGRPDRSATTTMPTLLLLHLCLLTIPRWRMESCFVIGASPPRARSPRMSSNVAQKNDTVRSKHRTSKRNGKRNHDELPATHADENKATHRQ
jgi:hypothetical protein